MKKKPSDEFLALQKEWYDKLKECGFNDIEILKGNQFELKDDPYWKSLMKDWANASKTVIQEANANYYRIIDEWLSDPETPFRSPFDRMIMQMHSEGRKKIEIFNALREARCPKSLATIRFIIRRYEEKWGLMTYAMNQMNRYPRKPTK